MKGVKQIISQINEELEPFCLTISDQGTSLIYILAQAGTTGLAYNLEFVEH